MKKNDLRSRWGGLKKKDQRLLLVLAGCLLLGVVLMSWDALGHRQQAPTPPLSAAEDPALDSTTSDQLEVKLEELLSQVKGAGKVQVALTYGDSAAAVYAYDNSTRTTSSQDSTSQDTESRIVEINNQPVLVSTTSPRVRGVLVVAEGGGDPLVKERLYQALSSLLGINASQIAIIEAEGSENGYEN